MSNYIYESHIMEGLSDIKLFIDPFLPNDSILKLRKDNNIHCIIISEHFFNNILISKRDKIINELINER